MSTSVGDRLVPQVYAQDALAAAEIRRIHDDLAVEPARPQQRRIEHVGAVGRGDEDHALVRLESIHLDEQLIQRLLALIVSATEAGATVAADRVDFIDEDDARRMRLALLEQVADAARADPDEHFHEIRPGHREEGTPSLAGHRARQQRLAGPRRPDQERALGKPATELRELLRVLQELDDLLQLDLRLIGAGDIGKRHLGRVTGQQLGLGLPERERLVATRLHLANEEDPERHEYQIRQDLHDRGQRLAGLLCLKLDVVGTQTVDLFIRILEWQLDRELLNVLAAHHDFLFELARNLAAGLDRNPLDVVLRQLLVILRIDDRSRLIRACIGNLEKDDGHHEEQQPERPCLGVPAPVPLLIVVSRRRWQYWHGDPCGTG